jgi:glycerol-3-phosphate dehydrogenase
VCEQADLASYTSSASTKLIHGGLRYLEHGEIGLVRKALREREVLLRVAPHLVRPLRFVLVHDDSMRPAWLLRGGLWLYDVLAGRSRLPPSRRVDLASHPAGQELKPGFRTGFEFSDASTDDARLVVTAAIDASERGARVFTRSRLVRARREGPAWVADVTGQDGSELRVRARSLVNATGPWAAHFLNDVCGRESVRQLRLIKGSHLVVRRRFGHRFAYLLQSADRRIAFAIPFEDDFTLIGTTDVEVHQEPDAAAIDAAETDYLCELANRYLRHPIGPADIAWSFSGVRPLLDDGAGPSELTRDYALEMDQDGAPLLTVWGGKITTFRTLAEEAVDRLAPRLGCTRGGWTSTAQMPGAAVLSPSGQVVGRASGLGDLVNRLSGEYPWVPPALLQRMAQSYGGRVSSVLGSARALTDLGEPVAEGLFEVELEYLVAREWARSADDALWRRSKLGLRLSPQEQRRVAEWFERRLRANA